MSISIHAPLTQEITTTEVQQSGAPVKRPLDSEENQKRVRSFMATHAQPTAPNSDTAATASNTQATAHVAGKPQVSAEEQQQAVLQKGKTSVQLDKRPGKSKALERVYKTLFFDNSNFFEQDMMSLLNALRSKRKSLVDLADTLKPHEKALRKYLLLEALKEHDSSLLTDGDHKEIQVHRQKILAEHGDFITGTLGAYNAGKAQAFGGPTLREFIQAYQVMEIQPNTTAATDLYALYKTIKKDLQAGASVEKLLRMQEGFIQVLAREKTQQPARITTPRHYLILSRIKQFGLLISLHALHNQFLKWGEKANIQGLPNAVSLTETCLQVVLSNETLAGANALIAIASAVRSDRLPAKNAFITNYCRSVLLHDSLSKMYRNPSQRKILVEHVERNTQLSAILAPVAPR